MSLYKSTVISSHHSNIPLPQAQLQEKNLTIQKVFGPSKAIQKIPKGLSQRWFMWTPIQKRPLGVPVPYSETTVLGAPGNFRSIGWIDSSTKSQEVKTCNGSVPWSDHRPYAAATPWLFLSFHSYSIYDLHLLHHNRLSRATVLFFSWGVCSWFQTKR